jgi:hypothetical protein
LPARRPPGHFSVTRICPRRVVKSWAACASPNLLAVLPGRRDGVGLLSNNFARNHRAWVTAHAQYRCTGVGCSGSKPCLAFLADRNHWATPAAIVGWSARHERLHRSTGGAASRHQKQGLLLAVADALGEHDVELRDIVGPGRGDLVSGTIAVLGRDRQLRELGSPCVRIGPPL